MSPVVAGGDRPWCVAGNLGHHRYVQREVICFGEFDKYYEVGTGLDYQVLKNASVYVGYRNVNVELETGQEITADNGLHVGMRLSF